MLSVITTDGGRVSPLKLSAVEATLAVPALSVNVPAATLMLAVADKSLATVGVNVAL